MPLFHADKGSQTTYTSITVFLLKQVKCIIFIRAPHLEHRLSSQVEEPLSNSCLLPCATLPPHLTLQLLLRQISCWSAGDFSKIGQDQVLWTSSIKVLFYSPSISFMHLKECQHIYGFEYVFRKDQSFWLLYIKTINTFYTCKLNKTGRLGTWNCSAPYIAQVLRLRLNIAIHALLTCLWLLWRHKVKG